MTLKDKTVFHSVKVMMDKGMDFNQAVAEIESILHSKIPDYIIELIRQELG